MVVIYDVKSVKTATDLREPVRDKRMQLICIHATMVVVCIVYTSRCSLHSLCGSYSRVAAVKSCNTMEPAEAAAF